MRTIGAEDARLMRARSQGLASLPRCTSVLEVVERVFAVQAQDVPSAALGLRARARGLTAEAVVRASDVERSVVRNWFMRGTLHLVAATDVRWLTELLGPLFLRLSARRYRELGLDADDLAMGEAVIVSALAADGPLSRAALTVRLAAAGLDARGQVPIHLIRRCALLGHVCHGPTLDGVPTFVLSDGWLPPADGAGSPAGPAVTELASRYLDAHGPASVADFTTWSGLPVGQTRTAWRELVERGDLVECEVTGDLAAVPAARADEAPTSAGDVRLLPAYDDYLVGWRTRALSVAAPFDRQVWPGGGQIRSTVVVDGMVRATWSRRDGGRAADLAPFEPLSAEVLAGVAAEEADMARFLGVSRDRPS